MPAALDGLLRAIDQGGGLRLIEPEAFTFTQQVFAVGVAIESPNDERQRANAEY